MNNPGVHIIKAPSGRFVFVGTLPTKLGDVIPATKSDALAGRAYVDDRGALVTVRFPAFDTVADAVAHAESRRVILCNDGDCACRNHF